MERFFRTIKGERVNVALHTLEMLKENPMCEIRVGTDSQVHGAITKYATVVAYKHPNNKGVHFVYTVSEVPRMNDIFSRLFREAEDSLEVAEYLTNETKCNIYAVELDFADVKNTKSSPAAKATIGWITGAGYDVLCKSSALVTTRAANNIVNVGKPKRERRAEKKNRKKGRVI